MGEKGKKGEDTAEVLCALECMHKKRCDNLLRLRIAFSNFFGIISTVNNQLDMSLVMQAGSDGNDAYAKA